MIRKIRTGTEAKFRPFVDALEKSLRGQVYFLTCAPAPPVEAEAAADLPLAACSGAML